MRNQERIDVRHGHLRASRTGSLATVLVGNPKVGSRTCDAARMVAEEITGSPPEVVELGALGAHVINPADAATSAALRKVQDSNFLVVASPTFKGSFSGLLKVFLDLLSSAPGKESLSDTVVLPLMLGAGPHHAMACDIHLRPVLEELGATVPMPGLFLSQESYREDGKISEYVGRWNSKVRSV